MQAKTTILIVDDEKSVRETIGSLLTLQGYNLIFATNGKEAIEKATEKPPDLVLLDIMMPIMDGYETCRRLRGDTVLHEVPIIMLSALDDKESRLQGIQVGADDFISKPFDFTELIARVKTITRLDRYRRLVEERNKFIKMVELLPDGIIVIDSKYEIIFVNEALLKIFNLKNSEEIIGKHFKTILTSNEENRCLEIIKTLLTGKNTVIRMEIEFTRNNGQIFPSQFSAGSLFLDYNPAVISIIRDITEQKIAEKALRDSESRYRSVSELISDFVYSFKVDENSKLELSWMTDALTTITGYTPQEIDVQNIVYPLDKSTVNSHLNTLLSGKSDVCEFRIINSEDEVRWLRNYCQPQLEKSKNRVVGLSGAMQDITERVLANRAIQESEERYHAIVEDQSELICRFEKNYKLIFVNGDFCRYFDQNPIELIGETFMQIVPENEQPEIINNISNLTSLNPITNFEHQYIRAETQIKWLQWSVRALYDKNGSLFEFLGVGNDITERKNAEELVKHSEEKYRTLFEESKDVIFVSTLTGKFIDINKSGVELFGYSSKDEILSTSDGDAFFSNPNSPKEILEYLQKSGFVKEFELTMKGKNGEQIIVNETSTAVYDQNGNIIGYRGILRDLTNVKQLERELVESQKMESIGRLSGGIAHDFNNMLTIIIGHADLAKMHIPPESKAYERISTIQQSAERAAWFVRQLLAFSRKQTLQVSTVDVNDIVKDFTKMLNRVIGEHIDLKINLKSDKLIAKIDVGQFYQVLLNLVVNARDAMTNGGALIIETGIKEVDEKYCRWHPESRPGNYVVISVTDSGTGIDKETIKKIFEPFFTTKKVGEGTGLGLSVVYGIVKQHEGFIVVYSEIDKGTTFKIHLPLARKAINESEIERPKIIGGKETILLVEDEDTLRNIALDALRYLGYNVFAAVNGLEALEIFRQNMDSIDLVLIDVVMPKLGGKEAVEEMRKLKPALHCLFTTGYSLNAIQTDFIVEQNAEVIQKPWSLANLSKKIREVLEK